jgi:hypothetical protein
MGEIYPETGPDTGSPVYEGDSLPPGAPFSSLTDAVQNFGPVEDVEPITPPTIPDHTASRDTLPGEEIAKKPSKVPTIPASKVEAQLVKPLTEIYQFIGGMIILFDPYCGTPWVTGAEDRARAVAEIAQRNDAVRKALLFLVESSDAAQLMMLHAPLMMAPLMHHAPIGPKLTDDQIAQFLAQSNSAGDNES